MNLNLFAAAPELLIAFGAVVLLMVGVFRYPGDTDKGTEPGLVYWLSIAALLAAAALSVFSFRGGVSFGGVFSSDPLTRFARVLIYVSSAVALLLSRQYMSRLGLLKFEFPVLVLFAALGMSMMAAAHDFIALYVGLELQSLSLYVLAAFRRDSSYATEAGLKYFVLGALSSGLLLFGISFIYGTTGGTDFAVVAGVLNDHHSVHPGLMLLIGLALTLAGLAFKISAAPFHMWTPDVYEGSPTPVTAFFATAPKVAAGVLLIRVLFGPLGGLSEAWGQIVAFLAAASMLVGAVAALGQTNIKRLMAYSSIGHMGYLLVGLASGTTLGARAVLIYLAIYIVTNIGVFAIILGMRRDNRQVTGIDDLSGLAQTDMLMALCLTVLLISLSGIPPLAGFFAKLAVFQAALDQGLLWLVIIGVIASVISAFYYWRIIRLMFFPDDEGVGAAAFETMSGDLRLAMVLSTLAVVIFVFGGLGLDKTAGQVFGL